MSSAREMRLRIGSVQNIAQVTRALEAVSASKVRKAIAAVEKTRPYATKAWQVLTHVAGQPGRNSLHPLLATRGEIRNALVLMISGDRGLAGAYNTNILRYTARNFDEYPVPVQYIAVGRKGRDLLIRRGKQLIADFSDIPAAPSFMDISAIGRLAVREFLAGKADEVHLVYTDFVTMLRQEPVTKKLLPLELGVEHKHVMRDQQGATAPAYIFEPAEQELLDEIIPRFTALQVYQAVLEAIASEHAARMVAMRNATENAVDLVAHLKLEYNKVRQQAITNDILDIVGGAEALS
ncbi:MAG: ATP synthase F1 subunit gamma [Anaerolineales bacterium]|nr:ATP synthase F1 subunit gamma [Anaerolineales bacterium]